MVIPMPADFQKALREVQHQDLNSPQRLFLIAIAEHMILLFAQYQWGGEWEEYGVVLYNTDNQNSHSAATKKFASNAIMQDLCRLSCMLEFAMHYFVQSVWWPTWTNLIADALSRLLDVNGATIPAMQQEFDMLNAKLARPYVLVSHKQTCETLIVWVRQVRSAFTAAGPIHMAAEQLMLQMMSQWEVTPEEAGETVATANTTAAQGSNTDAAAMSAKEELRLEREVMTIADMKAWCRSEEPALSCAYVGSGSCVGTMRAIRTRLWRPTWASEVQQA